MKLLPYAVETVPDFEGVGELLAKRRALDDGDAGHAAMGHFGLLFTWGLPWTTLAVLVHPTLPVVAAYWGSYLVFRVAMTWLSESKD